MKRLQSLSLPIILCGILLLNSCIENRGNTLSITSTGSIYKSITGENYLYIDQMGTSATSTELINGDWEEGDRMLATTTINFDRQESPLIRGVYNATITDIRPFECKSYTPDRTVTSFQSDTLPTLYLVDPFIIYRTKDDIITLGYTIPNTEGEKGSLKLVQPRPFDANNKMKTDTLYLVYDKGNVTESSVSDYVSFKLPPYPVNTNINVVIRFKAENYNLSIALEDKTSKYFSFPYYRPERLL